MSRDQNFTTVGGGLRKGLDGQVSGRGQEFRKVFLGELGEVVGVSAGLILECTLAR